MSDDTPAREAARDLVQRTALLLDEESFTDWIALFDPAGTYVITAYSDEIHRWMIWQQSDPEALGRMLGEVDEHVRDPARRRHVVGYPLVELDGEEARVTTPFSLYRTLPDGQSSLYMVGCYRDRLVRGGNDWRYAEHKVVVDTRMLDAFTHIPV